MGQELPPNAAGEPFLVDMEGVMNILSEAIYSQGKEVFVREMIQNAQDAITARNQADPSFTGSVVIEVDVDEQGTVTVIFEDDGIGLTGDDARKALSTVGFGLKRNTAVPGTTSPFVGRFGIGALSAFLVADDIEVISKHAMEKDSPAIRWTGNKQGKFSSGLLDRQVSPGSRVYLRLRPEESREFMPETIFEIARKYGRYLPHPIEFRSGGETRLVNEIPLWEQGLGSKTLCEAGSGIFEEPYLSAFPFRSEASGSTGIAFVRATPHHPNSAGCHTVFIKRMLISTHVSFIHPAGAPFLGVLMNSDKLAPNAGRDNLMENDPNLRCLREDLIGSFLAHLRELSVNDPVTLESVANRQWRCLFELAETHEALLPLLMGAIKLDTSLGPLTTGQVLARSNGTIRCMSDDQEYLRIESKAKMEGDCIVRSCYEQSARMMRLLTTKNPGQVNEITSREYLASFGEAPRSLSSREEWLRKLGDEVLAVDSCALEYFDSDNPDELAQMEMDDEESIDRFLSNEVASSHGKTLKLNRENAIVTDLIYGSLDPVSTKHWVRMLYQIALLGARELPSGRELRHFNRSLREILLKGSLNTD